MTRSGYVTLHSVMARMCWGTRRAERAFTGEQETVAALWGEALKGRYPRGLGTPLKMKPADAMAKLLKAVQSGELTVYREPHPTRYDLLLEEIERLRTEQEADDAERERLERQLREIEEQLAKLAKIPPE